jgi:hypothetical protein
MRNEDMGEMENELKKIKERNARVEADKAWETSKTRQLVIAVITYLFAYAFLLLINAPNPQLNALVPVIGFAIATLTLPPLKEWWLKSIYRK